MFLTNIITFNFKDPLAADNFQEALLPSRVQNDAREAVIDIDGVFGSFGRYAELKSIYPPLLDLKFAGTPTSFQLDNQQKLKKSLKWIRTPTTNFGTTPKPIFKSTLEKEFEADGVTLKVGTPVLVKKLLISGTMGYESNSQEIAKFLIESLVYKSIQYHGGHKNIRKLYGIFWDNKKTDQSYEQLVMIMEWVSGDTFYQLSDNYVDRTISPDTLFLPATDVDTKRKIVGEMMVQTTVALQFLHRCGWYHNDLKTLNVFVDGAPFPNPNHDIHVKLHDFDNARPVYFKSDSDDTTMLSMPPEYLLPYFTDADWAIATTGLGVTRKKLNDVKELLTATTATPINYEKSDVFQLGTVFLGLIHSSVDFFIDVIPNPQNPANALEVYYQAINGAASLTRQFHSRLLTCVLPNPAFPLDATQQLLDPPVNLWPAPWQVTAQLKKMMLALPINRPNLDTLITAFTAWRDL